MYGCLFLFYCRIVSLQFAYHGEASIFGNHGKLDLLGASKKTIEGDILVRNQRTGLLGQAQAVAVLSGQRLIFYLLHKMAAAKEWTGLIFSVCYDIMVEFKLASQTICAKGV